MRAAAMRLLDISLLLLVCLHWLMVQQSRRPSGTRSRMVMLKVAIPITVACSNLTLEINCR